MQSGFIVLICAEVPKGILCLFIAYNGTIIEDCKTECSSGSWFPIPDSWFLIPGSWFPIPGSRFLVPGSWFLIPDSFCRQNTMDEKKEKKYK